MFKRKTKSFFLLLKNKKLLKQIKWKYYLNTNHSPKNTIFLSGMARSGTTWLSQILNYNNDYRYIFEPFYPEHVEFCSFFKKRQYLRPTGNYPEFFEAAQRIVSGNFRIQFIDRYNEKFFAKKRLIKDVQTNLLFGWLNRNFKEMKSLLIIRHPCAIANSFMKLGWEPQSNVYFEQPELVEDYLHEFEKDIKGAKTEFEKILYMWSIEYYVPLKQQKQKLLTAKSVLYEDLCERFEDTMTEVYTYLGKRVKRELFEVKDKPSYTARPFAAVIKRTNLLDSWKKELTSSQIKKATDIVTLFELDNLYDLK